MPNYIIFGVALLLFLIFYRLQRGKWRKRTKMWASRYYIEAVQHELSSLQADNKTLHIIANSLIPTWVAKRVAYNYGAEEDITMSFYRATSRVFQKRIINAKSFAEINRYFIDFSNDPKSPEWFLLSEIYTYPVQEHIASILHKTYADCDTLLDGCEDKEKLEGVNECLSVLEKFKELPFWQDDFAKIKSKFSEEKGDRG
jgi:hypothetical protein